MFIWPTVPAAPFTTTSFRGNFAGSSYGGLYLYPYYNTHITGDNLIIADNEANTPPAFTSTPGLTGAVGSLYTYAITTFDADGDTLTIVATTKPDWLTLTDHGNGTATLSGTPTAAATYDVTLQVSDGQEGDTQRFSIIVDKKTTAPKILLPLIVRNT